MGRCLTEALKNTDDHIIFSFLRNFCEEGNRLLNTISLVIPTSDLLEGLPTMIHKRKKYDPLREGNLFTQNSDYVTQLKKLQHLSTVYRITFKIFSLTYKFFYNLAPARLSNDICHSAKRNHQFSHAELLADAQRRGFLRPLCFSTWCSFLIRRPYRLYHHWYHPLPLLHVRNIFNAEINISLTSLSWSSEAESVAT